MGEVFLAHDEILNRDVAIKILREEYADDEEFVRRFRREAQRAASFNHSNIVHIYDWGCTEDGTYYMAMEHVPGGTLKEHISEMVLCRSIRRHSSPPRSPKPSKQRTSAAWSTGT
jgi:serine/threonine-protein kinase